MTIEKFNTINKENINKVVIEFYVSILFEDNAVSEVFREKLGEDVTTTHWQEHFATLTNFWAMMILKDDQYKGNPMKKHFDLGLTKDMFVIWLRMFFDVIDLRYEEHLANKFKSKANTVAAGFMRMLNLGS
jgi:hemoglobin